MRDRRVQRKLRGVSDTIRALFLILAALGVCQGCAAFRPLRGVPVSRLSDEYLGETKSGRETIDLTLLTRREPPEYLVDGGDVLGIYIENIFPKVGEIPPVYYPPNNDTAPTMGYPVPVREDGSVTLPGVGRISVRGMTVIQIEDLIRQRLLDTQYRQQNSANVTVTLQKRRMYQVMVIRQESIAPTTIGTSGMGSINLGEVKRGTGQIVNLQAYRNDVAHALAQTGGLPGLDAENAIYILRGVGKNPPQLRENGYGRYGSTSRTSENRLAIRAQSPDDYRREIPLHSENRIGFSPTEPDIGRINPLLNSGSYPGDDSRFGESSPLDWERFQSPPSTADELIDRYGGATEVIRIPIRLFPGEEIEFGPEDVILHDGDIIFIESRETEIFYTGGLLGGGQYTLPRDYDLDVLGAVSIANGRQQTNSSGGGFGNRIGGISAMNQDISVSASVVVVLRQLPDGGQIPIKVNLYKAMRHPEERILIQPGDFVILQYTPIEAVGAFIERNLLAGSLIGLATQQNRSN